MGAISEANKSDGDWLRQRRNREKQLEGWTPSPEQLADLRRRLRGDERLVSDELAWFVRRYRGHGFGGLSPDLAFDGYLRGVPPLSMTKRGAA